MELEIVNMNIKKIALATVFLILISSVVFASCTDGNNPPGSGVWAIVNTTTCSDMNMGLNTSLNLGSSAAVTFQNVTLSNVTAVTQNSSTGFFINSSQLTFVGNVSINGSMNMSNTRFIFTSIKSKMYGLKIQAAAAVNITGGSNITTTLPATNNYTFIDVESGSTFGLYNSYLSKIGSAGNPIHTQGVYIGTNNAIIYENTFNDCYNCIYPYIANNTLVQNNIITNAVNYFYYGQSDKNSRVLGNTFTTTTACGVEQDSSSGNWTVSHNTISDFQTNCYGIYPQAPDVYIYNNTVFNGGHTDAGAIYTEGARTTIRNNTVYDTGIGIFLARDSIAEDNTIINATYQGGIVFYQGNGTIARDNQILNSYGGFYAYGNTISALAANNTITGTTGSSLNVSISNLTVINTTHNTSQITVTGANSNLTIQWYIQGLALYNGVGLTGASFYLNNTNNVSVINETTGTGGTTSFYALTEYYRNNETTTYLQPYTGAAIYTGFIPGTATGNISASGNFSVTLYYTNCTYEMNYINEQIRFQGDLAHCNQSWNVTYTTSENAQSARTVIGYIPVMMAIVLLALTGFAVFNGKLSIEFFVGLMIAVVFIGIVFGVVQSQTVEATTVSDNITVTALNTWYSLTQDTIDAYTDTVRNATTVLLRS